MDSGDLIGTLHHLQSSPVRHCHYLLLQKKNKNVQYQLTQVILLVATVYSYSSVYSSQANFTQQIHTVRVDGLVYIHVHLKISDDDKFKITA